MRSASQTSAMNTSSMVATSAPSNTFIEASICSPSPPAPTKPRPPPELTSHAAYRWHSAIPPPALLGYVGAGGLGLHPDASLKRVAVPAVAPMLQAFLAHV